MKTNTRPEGDESTRLAGELRRWSTGEGEKTVGTLTDTFGEKSYMVLFVILLSAPALPVPTGGLTHVLEVVAMLLAMQLAIGRTAVWIPARWQSRTLVGPKSDRFVERLLRLISWLERRSRRRGTILLNGRVGNAILGTLVFIFSLAAFLAPPFSMLDTLPALGVVVLSVGVLTEDSLIAGIGIAVGAVGVALVAVLGHVAFRGIESLL